MAYDIGPRIGVKGEKEFNMQIQSCNNSLKELGSELKAVKTKFDSNANSQEALTRKSEIMAKQLETQKQKLATLQSQYEKETKKLNELKDAAEAAAKEFGENSKEAARAETAYKKQETVTSKLKVAINETKSSINKLNNELGDNETKLKEIEDGTRDAETGFKDMGENAKTAGDKINEKLNAQILTEFARKAKEVAKAVLDIAINAGKTADDLNTMSKKTGISTSTLQKFSYASDIVDVSIEDIGKGLSRTTKAIGSNSDEFAKLGVSTKDVSGKLRSSEAVFFDTIDALGRIEDETKRDIIAQELFGKTFQNLNPLIETGTDDLKALYQEAEDHDLILSQEELDRANELNDDIDKISASFEMAGTKIGAAFAPVIDKFLDFFSENVMNGLTVVLDWFVQIPGPIKTFTAAFVGLIAVIAAIIPIIIALAAANTMLDISLLPLIVTALAIAAAIAIVVTAILYWDEICAWFKEQWDIFCDQISTAWGVVKDFFVKTWNAIVDFVTKTVPQTLNNIVNWFAQLPGRIWKWLSACVDKVVNWGSQMWSNAKKAASELVNGFIDTISSLPGKLYQWGVDAVKNFVDGIKSMIRSVVDSAKDIASAIAEFLHFSEPDVGPLSNASTFMPDMMKLYAKGIKDNIPMLKKAVGEAAGAMVLPKATVFEERYEAIKNSGTMTAGFGGKTVVFNQYNNSPKALSSIEIYRQTRNQLSALRGNAL